MPGFNFDMAMGVQYEVDLTRPAGERIADLTRERPSRSPTARR